MASKYTRPLTDTPYDEVNEEKLRQEMNDSSITQYCQDVERNDSDIEVKFASSLSGAEITTMDGIIAAHDPSQSPSQGGDDSEGETTTTSATYVNKLTESLELGIGDYLITAYAEFKSDEQNKDAELELTVDDVQVCWAKTPKDTQDYISFCGVYKLSVSAFATHDVKINFRQVGGDTARIRRARIFYKAV